MHAIGVESDSPTWAEENEAALALYRLEGQWREMEQEWVSLDANYAGDEYQSTYTGHILSRAALLADDGMRIRSQAPDHVGIEPLIRWCQNERHREDVHRSLARRYRQVADRLEQRARAAKQRGGRLRQLLARYLQILGRQRLSTGGIAYVQDRPQLVVDQAIADTIPDEWYRIKRTLQQRLILRAHAKGEPIPLACAVVDVPMVVIRD